MVNGSFSSYVNIIMVSPWTKIDVSIVKTTYFLRLMRLQRFTPHAIIHYGS